MAAASAYAHCETEVRRDDRDRWLASLFLPDAARPHVHALLAFNLEMAKVRDTVSEPMLGEIRFQWWRDALANGAAAGHPAAEALLDTVVRCKLDIAPLLALIEARSFDLYDDPMPSLDAYEGYVHATSATLFACTAQILAPGFPASAATQAAGRAYAMTGLLRGLPWQVMKGQLYLPLDVLARFQLPPDEVLAHRNSPALGFVLNDLRARVRGHLKTMHAALPDCPAPLACLPAFLCESYLRRMEKPGLDPFATPIELPQWRRQWVLWRAARGL
ncbi:squalene/phytoene synthase family protein [Beijerinckia sp. L45]|uniref:phytoene/squalene synthase family protein n=1 Tax=Beijerinckia sp. L45 TaxID=1641855 RepID=UPI00131D25D6|nr:squalene/phytoene synthase family protein [Beijerinckia sp. L45]